MLVFESSHSFNKSMYNDNILATIWVHRFLGCNTLAPRCVKTYFHVFFISSFIHSFNKSMDDNNLTTIWVQRFFKCNILLYYQNVWKCTFMLEFECFNSFSKSMEKEDSLGAINWFQYVWKRTFILLFNFIYSFIKTKGHDDITVIILLN